MKSSHNEIILLSDVHGTSYQPKQRKDDIKEAFVKTWSQIFSYAQKKQAPIFQAGDLFDKPRDLTALFLFIDLFMKYKIKDTGFYTIYGQHDMYFRNKTGYTSNMNILKDLGLIRICYPESSIVFTKKNAKDFAINGHVYGFSYGEKVKIEKSIWTNMLNDISICMIHGDISPTIEYPGHKPTFLKTIYNKTKGIFDIILLGDIHRRHVTRIKNTLFINTGSLMRLKRDEQKQAFYTYDYVTKHTFPHRIEYEAEFKKKQIDYEVKTESELITDLQSIQEEEIKNCMIVIKELLKTSSNKKGIKNIIMKLVKENSRWMDMM